jgi:hypothetical protein
MSRLNNFSIRAVIREDGSISGFRLSNYSGGGSFMLRIQRLEDSFYYWVLEGIEGSGINKTMIFTLAERRWGDSHDLDELAAQALTLWREDRLEERDKFWRQNIESKIGETLPRNLPAPENLGAFWGG